MAFEIAAGKGKKSIRPTMNVTPLVDVVLVLLIIFMVVTPLLTRHFWTSVPLKEDKAQPPPPPAQEPPPQLVLRVGKDGSIWLNREQVAQEELKEKLRRVFAARHDNTLFFDADGDVAYGRAMEILDVGRGGGALTIAVLTDPSPAPAAP